jgi:membrane protein DedA with SNARE-associated domain
MQTAEIKDDPPAATEPEPQKSNTLVGAVVIAGLFLLLRLLPFKALEPIQNVLGSFSWLTEKALDIAKDLFESYGYLTVFLAPLLENTIFLGAIIPGTIIMLLGGLSAHDGLINIWYAIPLAILGAWIGDTISYGIGRFGWQRLGPESRMVKWAEEMREPLLEHTSWLVVLYHFAGYSRLIGPAASGFLRVPFARWVLLDYLGSALWVITFMTGGYMLGAFTSLSLESTDKNVRIVEFLLFGLAIISISLIMYRARTKKEEGPLNL